MSTIASLARYELRRCYRKFLDVEWLECDVICVCVCKWYIGNRRAREKNANSKISMWLLLVKLRSVRPSVRFYMCMSASSVIYLISLNVWRIENENLHQHIMYRMWKSLHTIDVNFHFYIVRLYDVISLYINPKPYSAM